MRLAGTLLLAFVAIASGQSSNVTYTTQVVTQFTTFLSSPTTLVYNDKTYIATAPTTLTVTNCPCTISAPVTIAMVTSCASACGTGNVGMFTSSNGSYTSPAPTTVIPFTTGSPKGASGTASAAATSATSGAANQAFVVSGAGLAGVFGLIAYLL